MLIKPDFFDAFRCKASACKDTCCAGWEIDADGDTAAFYESLDGENGSFVRERLHFDADGCHLCKEGARCGFLREDNLCELILRLGEDALCDICREHPRFYTGDGGITLAGHGMTCEEAARLWLEKSPRFVFVDDGELHDAWAAKELDSLMESLSKPIAALPDDALPEISYAELRALFVSLEAMDPAYPEGYSRTAPKAQDDRYANLAAYFRFRYHFELGEMLTAKLAAACCIMIAALERDLEEAAKAFSGEVEYDPDNMEKILDFLETHSIARLVREVFG